MMALPAASSLTRRIWNQDLPGSSVLAQHITLWVGFLGAALATLTGRHLALSTLDVVPRGLAAACRRVLRTGGLGRDLRAAGGRLLPAGPGGVAGLNQVAFGIREAWSQLVMPVGFALMALRFAWRADAGGPRNLALRAAAVLVMGGALLLGHLAPGTGFTALMLLLVLAAFLLGAPVFVVMAGVAMVLFFRDGTPIAAVPTAVFSLSTTATLPAIPLLTAAGYILAEGDAARRLVRVYKGIFGWMPGGWR